MAIEPGGAMDRIQRDDGLIQALCTLCQHQTQQRVLTTGRPGVVNRHHLHEIRRYRFCLECHSRQTISDDRLAHGA